MGVEDWNWKHPVELQDVAWDCAAASLTWALNAYGLSMTESEVVAGMGPTRISPTYGLLDATGAGLVSYLSELGISASSNPHATFQEILDGAGYQPMVMGGREWCHWTGVRIAGPAFGRPDLPYVLLANPAPGWWDVEQWMYQGTFDALGPFSAVWFPA